ncbi:MAG: hypothetical protein R2875_18630 [Desulfobacterales bacterium]
MFFSRRPEEKTWLEQNQVLAQSQSISSIVRIGSRTIEFEVSAFQSAVY